MAVRNTNKSVDQQVKEYVKKISEDDIHCFSMKLRERVGGDLSEVLVTIQERYNDLNRLLTNTHSPDEVYDVADLIERYIQDEIKRRMNYRPVK